MDEWPLIPPKNIILRMPNWIGDLVMCTAAIADIRHHFPQAKITALCQGNIGQLLINDPNIDEITSFQRPSGWIHRFEHFDIIQEIRRGEYDLGILFTNSFSSAWWFWRGKVLNRLGFACNFRSCLLTKAISFPKKISAQHQVETYKELLKPLGISLSNTAPKLYITDQEKAEAKEVLSLKGIPESALIVGINPGAAYGSAKCWLPDRFVEVSQKLLEHKELYIIYFGDTAGGQLVDQICEELPKERIINLAGKTSLRELLALINSCSIFLTNDSGPMHIAAALEIPLVALFGSTDDKRTGPYGIGKVIHKHVECSPCFKRVCPIDFKCMKKISVEEVYQELQKLANSK